MQLTFLEEERPGETFTRRREGYLEKEIVACRGCLSNRHGLYTSSFIFVSERAAS